MHGNMSQNARERSLAQFESGRVSTLIATDVAARGLDVDEITHVINFDPPHTDDDYVHRIGRTGRAGRTGTGVTLVLPEQELDVSRLAGRLGHADAFAASGISVPAPSAAGRARVQGGAGEGGADEQEAEPADRREARARAGDEREARAEGCEEAGSRRSVGTARRPKLQTTPDQ